MNLPMGLWIGLIVGGICLIGYAFGRYGLEGIIFLVVTVCIVTVLAGLATVIIEAYYYDHPVVIFVHGLLDALAEW
jgi:hypothetical protein